eukprot:564476-Hanusia_phi.AAC.1
MRGARQGADKGERGEDLGHDCTLSPAIHKSFDRFLTSPASEEVEETRKTNKNNRGEGGEEEGGEEEGGEEEGGEEEINMHTPLTSQST